METIYTHPWLTTLWLILILAALIECAANFKRK